MSKVKCWISWSLILAHWILTKYILLLIFSLHLAQILCKTLLLLKRVAWSSTFNLLLWHVTWIELRWLLLLTTTLNKVCFRLILILVLIQLRLLVELKTSKRRVSIFLSLDLLSILLERSLELVFRLFILVLLVNDTNIESWTYITYFEKMLLLILLRRKLCFN